MKIMILGGTGFIGTNAVNYFREKGHDVYATYFTHSPRSEAKEWFFCDLRDDSLLSGFDVVIHAAGITSGCKDTFERPWHHVTDNAVMGSWILRAALQVKHFIYMSCSTMYSSGVVNEETIQTPHPRYFGMVNTKLYLEKMCEFYANSGNTKFTVIRGSNFFGPYDKYSLENAHMFGATVNKVMSAKDGDAIEVWGDGTETRDITYIDNLIQFMDKAIENQKDKFRIYNCGSGISLSIREIAENIIKESGKNLTLKFDTSKPSIPVSFTMDCSRASEELGWKPVVGLEDGIRKTLSWYKDNML